MLRVFANRFDDEEQSASAVDLAGYAVGHSGPDEPAFGKVMKPVDAQRVAVLQKKHDARGVFPRLAKILDRVPWMCHDGRSA